MALRKRNGQWWYRIIIQGREVESRTTGLEATNSNERKALRIHDQRRDELLAVRGRPVESPLFPEACKEFLDWAKNVEYRSKANTFNRIKTSFASIQVFCGVRAVNTLAPIDIERYKTWRATEHRVQDVTIRHDLDSWSLFFKYAIKAEWCDTNPILAVKKPSDRDAVRQHVLSDAEERAYFSAAANSPNLYDVARLMLLQGCRPEEIMALQPADIDLSSRTLTIRGGKTKAARRTLDLCGESVEIFQRRMVPGSRWIFPSPRYPGHHLTKIQFPHDRACREAGVSFVLYDLRHTFATRHADMGTPIPTIGALLGHSGLRMLSRYIHPQAEAKKDAMRKYEAAIKPKDLKVVGE